ncbi:GFA family protein [Marinobacter hydrocarbonoclasticus]|nr:GFA family protein [Marinobacter nauticus]
MSVGSEVSVLFLRSNHPLENCHFCKRCGSHLVAERPAQPHVIVRVATLDYDPGLKPEAHIWVSHDVPWLEYDRACKHREWQDDI